MVREVLAYEYPKYVEAVERLRLFLESQENCGEKEIQALHFFQKAKHVIEKKLKSCSSAKEYSEWCDFNIDADSLVIMARQYSTPACLQRAKNEFEKLAYKCFEEIAFLTSSKCVGLYIDS